MKKTIEFTCPVLSVESLNPQAPPGFAAQKLITFFCPEIAATAVPGQFVALATSRFLRRPLGIARVDRQQGTVAVGGRAKGEGMAHLLNLTPGAVLSVLGPLGSGYRLDGPDTCLVAGGGTGVYPMLFLLETLRERGVYTGAAFGFRSAADAVWADEFRQTADCCVLASESNDLDVPGTVPVALTEVHQRMRQQRPDLGKIAVLTCGPVPMMQRVAAYAEHIGAACQVSLEERMACGVGLCLVCVCKTKDPRQPHGWHHTRCCKEGPVYAAEEVIWP
jgi:dihydroorotate dehydrogenase electron transfer subunit